MSRPFAIQYTIEAEDDLGKIWGDLAEARGAQFAKTYLQRLRLRIGSLARQPRRYRVKPRLGKGRRLMPEKPYHIIYRVDLDCVVIVRVLHGRRRITRQSIES